jgi:hypothetical protein
MVRTEMKIAYTCFARAFREAAEYLRAGDRLTRFPRGSFPPACRLSEQADWRSARRRRQDLPPRPKAFR